MYFIRLKSKYSMYFIHRHFVSFWSVLCRRVGQSTKPIPALTGTKITYSTRSTNVCGVKSAARYRNGTKMRRLWDECVCLRHTGEFYRTYSFCNSIFSDWRKEMLSLFEKFHRIQCLQKQTHRTYSVPIPARLSFVSSFLRVIRVRRHIFISGRILSSLSERKTSRCLEFFFFFLLQRVILFSFLSLSAAEACYSFR